MLVIDAARTFNGQRLRNGTVSACLSVCLSRHLTAAASGQRHVEIRGMQARSELFTIAKHL